MHCFASAFPDKISSKNGSNRSGDANRQHPSSARGRQLSRGGDKEKPRPRPRLKWSSMRRIHHPKQVLDRSEPTPEPKPALPPFGEGWFFEMHPKNVGLVEQLIVTPIIGPTRKLGHPANRCGNSRGRFTSAAQSGQAPRDFLRACPAFLFRSPITCEHCGEQGEIRARAI